ncbi:MAG TPA: DNA polymerase ligase N-terminal domain-containing protein [archaeon]|nr:DNA polymerase ligase N-terminal domain-containing protein [archaeon]
MPLKEYKRKRDFRKTPEPPPELTPKMYSEISRYYKIPEERPIYVVQKHAATRLHWDLRLEFAGVLRSWAVTKEPKMDTTIRRLAIATENHPLEYGSFSGIISEGYGAGTVEIWDNGTFETIKDEKGKIIVDIKGKKLRGRFALIKTAFSQRSWLFFKMKE